MEANMNLLKEVIKNCNVGVDAIDNIWENVKDTKLRETLWKQKTKILDLSERASKELGDTPSAVEGTYPNKMERAMMKMGVKMKSGLDKSTTNIAEMLIEGNNMGINDVVKTSHLYSHEDTPFAGELIKLYDANVKELRRFL